MPVSPVARIKVGDLVLAAEAGVALYATGQVYQVPAWCQGSRRLARAFRFGWLNAERAAGMTAV